ncbi:hypothetical protein F5884DRAFT_315101 [Xylogone sp. PMI_703]|nr:hypothetical protein F5884DRAFT_315101 [Xylogone sp. PMI_703]
MSTPYHSTHLSYTPCFSSDHSLYLSTALSGAADELFPDGFGPQQPGLAVDDSGVMPISTLPSACIREPTNSKKIIRRAQNRASQRAFRDRQKKYVESLKRKIQDMERAYERLVEDNKHLESEIAQITGINGEHQQSSGMADSPSHQSLKIDQQLTNGDILETAPSCLSGVCEHEQGDGRETGEKLGGVLFNLPSPGSMSNSHGASNEDLIDLQGICEKLKECGVFDTAVVMFFTKKR